MLLVFNNFAFDRHDPHSPARLQSWDITREFKPEDSFSGCSLSFAALRGGSHKAATFTTREPPQKPILFFPHASLLFPPGSVEAASLQRLFQLWAPPPPSKIRPDGCGVCACAGKRPGSGEGVAGPQPRLEKAAARGSGGGVGPGLNLLFPPSRSRLRPWPGSHMCALKTHFKVCCSPRRDSPWCGPPTRPGPLHPFQSIALLKDWKSEGEYTRLRTVFGCTSTSLLRRLPPPP